MTIKFKILCVGILLSVMNPLFLSADTNERKLWIDHLLQIILSDTEIYSGGFS